jgi:H+/Cl- antiporter ClcA
VSIVDPDHSRAPRQSEALRFAASTGFGSLEFEDARPWPTRSGWWRRGATALGFLLVASMTAIVVAAFTQAAEAAAHGMRQAVFGQPLLASALLVFGGAVIAAMMKGTGASGSGLPQVVMAADDRLSGRRRRGLVSCRIALAKIWLSTLTTVSGFSAGVEGPAAQVGASLMHSVTRWLPRGSDARGWVLAGAATGVATAFGAPLGGALFALEELARRRSWRRVLGCCIAALIGGAVLSLWLATMSAAHPHVPWPAQLLAPRVDAPSGTADFFGPMLDAAVSCLVVLGPLVLATALLGAFFNRLLITGLSATPRLAAAARRHPVALGAFGGLLTAAIGALGSAQIHGSGLETVHKLLAGGGDAIPPWLAVEKLLATWILALTNLPGGLFAPTVTIGAGVGHAFDAVLGLALGDVNAALGLDRALALGPWLVLIAMATFLAAVTQAPWCSAVMVCEIAGPLQGLPLLLVLAWCSARVVRRWTPPLYSAAADALLGSLDVSTAGECPPKPSNSGDTR